MKLRIAKLRKRTEFGRPTHQIYKDGTLWALTYSQESALLIIGSLSKIDEIERRIESLEAEIKKGD